MDHLYDRRLMAVGHAAFLFGLIETFWESRALAIDWSFDPLLRQVIGSHASVDRLLLNFKFLENGLYIAQVIKFSLTVL